MSFIGYIGKSSSAAWELKGLVALEEEGRRESDFVAAAGITCDISYRSYTRCNSLREPDLSALASRGFRSLSFTLSLSVHLKYVVHIDIFIMSPYNSLH